MPTDPQPNDAPSTPVLPSAAVSAVAGAAVKLDAAVDAVPYRTWLTGIVLFAVLLQIILVVGSSPIASDGITFINLARELPHHPIDAMRAADQSPGFPALVLVGRLIVWPFVPADSVESWIWGARLISGIFGVLAILTVWRMADRMFDRRSAIVAAVLVAILPLFRRNAADALSDTPHLFVYLVAVSLAIEAIQRRQAKWFVYCGLASGVAYWMRPEGLSVAIVTAAFLPLWAWRTQKLRMASAGRFAGVMLLAAAAVAAPYVIMSGKITSKVTNKERFFAPEARAVELPSRTVSVQRVETKHLPDVTNANEPEWKSVWGFLFTMGRRLTGELAQAFVWVLMVPLVVGAFVSDSKRDRVPAHTYVLCLVGFHAMLLVWLFWAGGYMNERHVMVIVALAMPRIGAGVMRLAERISGRLAPVDASATTRRVGWAAGAIVGVTAILALWLTLQPMHPSDVPAMMAARELRNYAKPGDEVLSNTPFVAFYAQIPGRVITRWDDATPGFSPAAVGASCRFIVFDTHLAPFRGAWLDEVSERYERLFLSAASAKNIRAFIERPALPPAGT